ATSFEAVTRFVSDARASERFAHLETRQRQQQELFASMIGGDGQHGLEGLQGLTAELAKLTGAHVAVSRYGEVLAGPLDVDDDAVEGWDVIPIAATPTTQATVHVSQPRRNDDLLTVARSLVGLSLSQEARRIRHSRTIAGQVVDDLIQGRLDAEEA